MNYQEIRAYWNSVFAHAQPFDPSQPLTHKEIENGLHWLVRGAPAVLDFGCGSGRALLRCLVLGAERGVGIDLSRRGIELARTTARISDLARYVRFIHGNVEALEEFSDTTFGAGILFNILDHLLPEDAYLVADNFRRLVAPRGRLLVRLSPYLTAEELSGNGGLQRIETDLYRQPSGLYLRNITDDALAELLPGFALTRKLDLHTETAGASGRLFYFERQDSPGEE
ncbi:MAG TPA: class I SAM-dependent methyltransferase [Anaerolineaceae bacterium]|nr:class I SAM-dependent methyltransferase [Anaerolineaceae bacterium]